MNGDDMPNQRVDKDAEVVEFILFQRYQSCTRLTILRGDQRNHKECPWDPQIFSLMTNINFTEFLSY